MLAELRKDAEAEKLHEIASELWESFVGDGGRYGSGTSKVLFKLRDEVQALKPGRDYLQRLSSVIRAIEVVRQGRKWISKKEAQQTFERDIPRMQASAYWQ